MGLSLASLFTDHMVLQRSKPVTVWGWASPEAQVAVRFAGQMVEGKADVSGKWSIALEPMEASAEGRNLVVSSLAPKADSQPEALTIKDVLVGEVWICSGQSNMQMVLNSVNNGKEEVETAKYPSMRLFQVANKVSDEPWDRLESGAWKACTPEVVEAFSAVGYLFGREIHNTLNVPVGLISSSWGGTRIEAWTSRDSLMNDAPEDASVAKMAVDAERDRPMLKELFIQWQKDVEAILDSVRDVRNEGFDKGWGGAQETTDVTWKDMTLPCFWRAAGLEMNGIVWFRKTVDVPASWAGKELFLEIGSADKNDVTYFNNTHVGSYTMAQDPMAWNTPRKYKVDGQLAKAGENVIAVRVHSNQQAGGLHGPAHAMRLSCPSLPNEQPIALAGVWRYAIEADYGLTVLPEEPFGPESPHVPARLHNAMIHPLVPFSMRGVIWYQGESNVTRAVQYRTLTKLLVKDLRKLWNDQSIAFHLVQLANYLAQPVEPGESAWAMLREAQTQTLELPDTGMAVTIDIGDANDIHPRNKKDVALRLAYNALHRTYGMKDVPPCGPIPNKTAINGSEVRVRFDHAYKGLQINRNGDGQKLTGFAIAAADKKFVWADAKIDGDDSVILSSEKVTTPAYVRYAWADNPECNLYNGHGLPAMPFRTDAD